MKETHSMLRDAYQASPEGIGNVNIDLEMVNQFHASSTNSILPILVGDNDFDEVVSLGHFTN